MKRKTKSAVAIIAITAIIGGAFGYFKFTEQVEKPVQPVHEKTKAIVEVDGEILESKPVTKEGLLYPDDLTEQKASEVIHSMSHQKVQSGAQWGHEQITQEKVDRLLAVCKMNDYKHNDLYISILERWSKGDFSHAVEDHNAVWEIHQNGNEDAPGYATHLKTPQEEMYYIKEYFENPDNQNENEPKNGAQR
ncbi:DUF6241 domain-containing protein [Lysinibacillus xylanilyticus]|uniref:DUF6241 domain-containing protein n=1 Tax=Lysinibacillus xylanilyticus TaxID=582475 RepID=A0ABV3W0C0_9BACI